MYITTSTSPGVCRAVIVRIRARFDRSAVEQADQHRCGATTVPGHRADLMPARRHIRRDRRGDALIELQIAAIPGVIVKARHQVARAEARSLDGVLRVPAEHDAVN